jgi:hypothetical protein
VTLTSPTASYTLDHVLGDSESTLDITAFEFSDNSCATEITYSMSQTSGTSLTVAEHIDFIADSALTFYAFESFDEAFLGEFEF